VRRKRKNSVEEIMEFHRDKNPYQLVRDFHVAFGHPYNDDKPERLSITVRVDRGKWIAEEIMEYVQALDSDQIAQVDALVDLMYLILGSFVEMGFDPFNDARLRDMEGFSRQLATEMCEQELVSSLPADRLYQGSLMEFRTRDAERAIELTFNFIQASTTTIQVARLRDLLDWTLAQSAIVGANLHPYFFVVHDANMAKLWADGKPRYADDGKILKPEGYESPEKDMVNLMLNELDQEVADDEIPF
jgi:predicted HAD superfamily Cof-like phosphohydrolase